ncbi:hypothetical protein LWI29_002741 [Acer saccharum]|uniref:Uncharacterized protein n=1 Tax=Acer saccharum TaxID=4024 RepID=A0AA39S7M9_ACESA|nr:hypothetical protein LWI29_002741 [Acer saccharum]
MESSDLPIMAPGGLKVLKKVNHAIMKGFGDLELSFLDSTLGEKHVKHELSVFSVGGRVTSVGGPSSLVLPEGASSKVIQSFTPSRKRKLGKEVVDESMNPRLIITMEKHNFTHCLLLEQGFAFQTTLFCDKKNKMNNDLDKLQEENKKLLMLSLSLEVEKLDLSLKYAILDNENKQLVQANKDFAIGNEEMDLSVIPKWDREAILKSIADMAVKEIQAGEKAVADFESTSDDDVGVELGTLMEATVA